MGRIKPQRWHKSYQTSLKQLKSTQKSFSNLINKYKTNIKKTWEAIKEALGEKQVNRQVYDKKNITKIEYIVIILITLSQILI